MLKRLSVFLAVLILATVVADLVMGRKIVDGKYGRTAVPPYWEPGERDLNSMRKRLRVVSSGRQTQRTLRNWSLRYGWINTPGRATGNQGEELWINSLGARGQREVSAEPRPGATRVLCFGESYTYGTEVRDGEDWPARMEAREDRLEVLNFGVGAWGTDQALLRFREIAPDLDHDVVILGLMLENFCRNVNRSRYLYQTKSSIVMVKPRFIVTDAGLELVPIPYADEVELLEAGLAGRLFDDLAEHEYWSRIRAFPPFSNLARIRAARTFQERRSDPGIWTDRNGEPYRVTLALLEAFHREALELGARAAPIVIFHREEDHLTSGRGGSSERYWSGFLDDLAERGVPYIDTFDVIAEMRSEGGRAYGHAHHDAPANDVIAELVVARLAEDLPELR